MYVSAVLNTYRKTHLMSLDIIARCNKRLYGDNFRSEEEKAAQCLAEKIASSIPFHLVDNLEQFLNDTKTGTNLTKIGRPVGGLLLLHPLCMVMLASSVSMELRNHAREILAWIGVNMGVGQASLIANVSSTIFIETLTSADRQTSLR